MPTKKIEIEPEKLVESAASGRHCDGAGHCDDGNSCCHNGHGHRDHFGKRILMTLFGILLVYLTFYIATLMRNNIKQYESIGEADKMERSITVSGSGKVTGQNDIATTVIGYTNSDPDVSKAQTANKAVMDQLVADLKQLGIAPADLTSNYTIAPEYDYTQNGSVFKGYRVTNNVTVKIRDLSKISSILSLPAKYGANQVGGLNFTIDNPDQLKMQAREKAVLDAKAKAIRLSGLLGVRLGEVVSFNDYDNPEPVPVYAAADSAKFGMGGGASNAGPTEVSGGSRDFTINVSVTYKIYPAAY